MLDETCQKCVIAKVPWAMGQADAVWASSQNESLASQRAAKFRSWWPKNGTAVVLITANRAFWRLAYNQVCVMEARGLGDRTQVLVLATDMWTLHTPTAGLTKLYTTHTPIHDTPFET